MKITLNFIGKLLEGLMNRKLVKKIVELTFLKILCVYVFVVRVGTFAENVPL